MRTRTALAIAQRNRTNYSYWMMVMARVRAGYIGADDADTALVRGRLRTCRGRRGIRKALAMLSALHFRYADKPGRFFAFDEAHMIMRPDLYRKPAQAGTTN